MIVDANVVVSASIGRSLPLVLSMQAALGVLMIPEPQHREARLRTGTLAAQFDRDPGDAFRWTETVLFPIATDMFDGWQQEARSRLRPAGQKDWPLVALALASGNDVWSNDVDLFGTGIIVWNTFNIEKARHPFSAAMDDRI